MDEIDEPRRRTKEYDGILISYVISLDRFSVKLLRLFPLASIRLRNIQYIRQRSFSDLWDLLRDIVLHPFRSWYWPHPLFLGKHRGHIPYIIRTVHGRQIYVRMRTGFHYRLRAALGRAKSEPEADAP